MSEIGIYATVIISILGVAYPILLQVISKLDDTYSSTLAVELFEQEPRRKWFQIQLYISLIIVFLWTLKLKPLSIFSNVGFIMDNSAAILVITTTILLIISFILLVQRIFDYYIPSKYVEYLIKKHNENY